MKKIRAIDKYRKPMFDMRIKGKYIQIQSKYGRWVNIQSATFSSNLSNVLEMNGFSEGKL